MKRNKEWNKKRTPEEGEWTTCPFCADRLFWVDLGETEGAFFQCESCEKEFSAGLIEYG